MKLLAVAPIRSGNLLEEGPLRCAVRIQDKKACSPRLVLDRIAPPCREAPVSVDLPRLQTRADAARVLSFLVAEAGRGGVTTGRAGVTGGKVALGVPAFRITAVFTVDAGPGENPPLD
jgi:hypothetical protein